MDLREAIIDETRWPKIFRTLQSAGLFSSCGCSDCGHCQAAARRFLRGITRHAQYAGPHQRFRFGDRYPVLARSLGDQRFNLLIDSAHAPSIVALRIEREVPEGEWERSINEPSGRCAVGRLSWQHVWGDWTSSGGPPEHRNIGALQDQLVENVRSGWCGPTTWQLNQQDIPDDATNPVRGLYVIRWMGPREVDGTEKIAPCAYVGMAGANPNDNGSIRKRVYNHSKDWDYFHLGVSDGPTCRIFWHQLILPKGADAANNVISQAERSIRQAILRLDPRIRARDDLERLVNSSAVRDMALKRPVYRRLGFGNRQELESDLD